MNDTPGNPAAGETTLSNDSPSAWQTVPSPPAQLPTAAAPVILPPVPGYAGQGYPPAQAYPPPQGYPAPPQYIPPPPPPPGASAAAGQGGYQPVYDGRPPAGTPPPGAYAAPPYGAQPLQYPPAAYGQPGYPPQSNYGQAPVAEMLAAAMLLPRMRRRRRHFIIWPILFVIFAMFVVLHGCASFLHIL